MSASATLRLPATSANLGPGFDCLGLALDLYNETNFSLSGNELEINITGEGADQLPKNESNLIVHSFEAACSAAAVAKPNNLKIDCHNAIPLGSGLGSSAAATLTGILGARALLDLPLNDQGILELASEIEGHADNVTPALLGGLTIARKKEDGLIARVVNIPTWQVVVALPALELSTEKARLVLPQQVLLSAAVGNLADTALVVEALRAGDLELLQATLHDQLHQPYRLPLIPGAAAAIEAAKRSGAAACLSGAGPAVIAFHQLNDSQPLANAMSSAFDPLVTRTFFLKTLPRQ
jgi:homoserine kinase